MFYFGKNIFFLFKQGGKRATDKMVEQISFLAHAVRVIVQFLIETLLTGIGVFLSVMVFLYTIMYLIIFIRTVVPEIRFQFIRVSYFIFLILYLHFEPIYPFFMNLIAAYHAVALLFISY